MCMYMCVHLHATFASRLIPHHKTNTHNNTQKNKTDQIFYLNFLLGLYQFLLLLLLSPLAYRLQVRVSMFTQATRKCLRPLHFHT